MSRRRLLVAYDIADDKRLRSVYKAMNGFGDRIQYSVFICELNARERIQMEGRLRRLIHHTEDQVVIMDLGLSEREMEDFIATIGRDFALPVRANVI